jgi:ABC-type antimicrobial peptide transport system permease subunit
VRWAREDTVRWITIVGVAGDVHSFGLTQPDQPAVYVPYTQEHSWWRTWMVFALRSDLPASQLEKSVREAVARVDKNIAVADVLPMDERMDHASANRRFQLLLFGLFAVIALILAAVGTYGVVSYLVSQRTREIGVRIAVGAQRSDVLGLVLREGMLQVGIGMAVGIAVSLALSRVLSSLLFQTHPADPLTYIAVSIVLAAVALLASYIPARRATKVDPMVALRYE